MRVNKDKCSFMVKAVEYVGQAIDAEGLHHLPGKVEAVQNVKRRFMCARPKRNSKQGA